MSPNPAQVARLDQGLAAFEECCDAFTDTARELVTDPELNRLDAFTALVVALAQPSVTRDALLGTLSVALMRLAERSSS